MIATTETTSPADWMEAAAQREHNQTTVAIQTRLEAVLFEPSECEAVDRADEPVAFTDQVINELTGDELTEQFREQYSANRRLINSFGVYEASYVRTCQRLHLQKMGYGEPFISIWR